MTNPAEPSAAPYESDLWDALEEAEDPSVWHDETPEDFRAGYRAALRYALAVVTGGSVPRTRPTPADD